MSRKTWIYLLLALISLALVLLTGCTVRQIPLISTKTPTASSTAPLPFPIPPTPPARAPTPTPSGRELPALATPTQPEEVGLRRLYLPFAPFTEYRPTAARVLIIRIDGLRPDALRRGFAEISLGLNTDGV